MDVETTSILTVNESASQLLLRSGVLLTVYRYLPKELQIKFKDKYFATLKQSILQDHEGNEILSSLSDAGLDCIGLKGWELRKMYPEPNMRQMSDLDILIRPYDYNRIKEVMVNLGYDSDSESSWMHDNFHKDEITVEMHKRLTDDSDVIREWEKGVWDRAIKESGNIYKMSPEDFYIFHFIHLHKDFMNGSLGLRRIVDTWLLQKQPVDMSFVNSHFKAMGLDVFHDRMVKLSRACMGDEEFDENSEIMLDHAFKYGIFGSDKSYKAGRIASMSKGNIKFGKIRSLTAAVFLPYGRMKAQFPQLEGKPYMLPYYWAVRIGRFLKGDLKKHKAKLDYSNISQEDYEEMKRFFEAGGVA